ncbi:MAG: MopE-related protein, partial [Planctomycetota bacterium]
VLACTAGSAQAQSVVGWGSNLQGQLNGTSSVGAVTEISSGIYHNVGARQNGTIVAWGSNNAGQLDVPTPALTDVTCVSAGDYHSIAARANGTVACWGDNFFGACDIPVGLNNVVGVSAGEQFSGALLADGTVVVWGWDSLNRLGVPADLTRVIKLDLGADFGVALRSTGNVIAWGTGARAVPPIGLLAKDISAGVTHSIAIRLDGTLACWGTSNVYGECTPPLEAASSVAVAAGSQFSLGLRADGKVVCWGKNNRGQAPAAPGFAPVTNGVAIAAGFEHSIASQNPAGIQAPTATLVAATATSCGNINGAIDVTVTNAETSWWTGPNGFFSNSDDLSGLAAGSYTLLVVGPGGSATLSVVVNAVADTIAPVIASYNASASAPAGANCTAIVPDFTASVVASDNCTASGALTITQSPAAGASVGLGANTVVITVKDASLNQTTANATFTVSGTAVTYYNDADGDGFGAINDAGTSACSPIVGKVVDHTDCNDLVFAIHPGATEVCNHIDDNCVGGIDEGLIFNVYYRDADSDGYGDKTDPGVSDCVRLAGTTTNRDDCNDLVAAIHPGAAELCADSTVDNNCDGVSTSVDTDAADKVNFYRDEDLDTYSINVTAKFCTGTINAGYIAALSSPIDCNDLVAAIHPGAAELCADSTVDNNCDGVLTGVDTNAADKVDFYRDQDNDNYSINLPSKFCTGTTNPGWIPTLSSPIDCVDTNAAIHPGAAELCADSTVDNNCDGVTTSVDTNAADKVDFFRDQDGDTYSINVTAKFCPGTINAGYIAALSSPIDCVDTNAAIHP